MAGRAEPEGQGERQDSQRECGGVTAVNAESKRETVEMDVRTSEDGAF